MHCSFNATLVAFLFLLRGVQLSLQQEGPQGQQQPQAEIGFAGSIICASGRPKFYIDAQESYVRFASWRSLCAQRRFGGDPYNAEGYCANWLRPRRVLFDPYIANNRLGSLRTHCSSLVAANGNRLPRNDWPRYRNVANTKVITADGRGSNTGFAGSTRNYPSILDSAYLGDYFHSSSRPASAASSSDNDEHSNRVLSTQVMYANDEGPFQAARFDGIHNLHVSLHERNKITCQGPLPPWHFEAEPLSIFEYQFPPRRERQDPSIQILCATALGGGHPSGNAGGLCLHHLPGREGQPTVGFSDTWGAGDRFANQGSLDSLAVRLWCFKHCWCADSGDLGRAPPRLVPGGAIPGRREDLNVDFTNMGIRTTRLDNPNFFNTIIPSEYRLTSSDGTGADAGAGSSRPTSAAQTYSDPKLDLPSLDQEEDGVGTEIHLATPQQTFDALSKTSFSAPIKIDLFGPPSSASGEQGQCGNRCSSRRDCSGGCACAVDPDTELVRKLGLDPVFPVAGCVALSLVAASAAKQVSGGLKLWGKRDGMVRRGWPCVCNASYVAEACCGSADGVVWEERGMGRRGTLLVRDEEAL